MADSPQHLHNPCLLDTNEQTPAKVWELLRRNNAFRYVVERLEAKWQVEPIVQGDLAVLDSRVSGHSQIGRGIFITAGCFSADGIAAHERLRPSAVIGIDGQDLYYLLERALPLDEVFRRKLRWLVETGHFHHPIREFMTELEKHQ